MMRAWKRLIDSQHCLNNIVAGLFFMMGAAIYFWVYKHFPPYLTNDSAVEILQVRDFQPWSIQAFIPSYKHGLVAVIESAYGYFMQPFLWMLGEDISTFTLALGMVFASTTALFFVLVRKIFSFPVAVLTTLVYVTSAYTIWWPLLLLRNAFGPLLVILILLGFIYLRSNHLRCGFSLLIIASFVAVNTYSTFKVVVPALFASAFLAGILSDGGKAYTQKIAVAAAILVLLLGIFFISADINLNLLLRGNYMLHGNDLDINRDVKTYALFFVRSFFLPVYQNPDGFLAEPTHFIFGRSMLNIWLSGVWILGLGAALYQAIKKEPTAVMCLSSLVLSAAILCIGGPSLKTHFALVPIEFILVAYGLHTIIKTGNDKKLIIIMLSIYMLFVSSLEPRYMFNEVKAANAEQIGSIGQDVGVFLKEHSKEFDVVIYASYGVDLMRLYYPSWVFKSRFVPLEHAEIFNPTLLGVMKEYNRVWLVLTPQSPFYSSMLSSKDFCFERNINNREDAALLVRCKKH